MKEIIIGVIIVVFALISVLAHLTSEYCEDEETEYFCRRIGNNFLLMAIATTIILLMFYSA